MASQPAPEQELSAKSASASDVFPSNARSSVQDQDEEDEVVEQDYSSAHGGALAWGICTYQ